MKTTDLFHKYDGDAIIATRRNFNILRDNEKDIGIKIQPVQRDTSRFKQYQEYQWTKDIHK